jgi:hypothetical protein
MGAIKQHRPVLLLLAAFSRYDTALDWACEQASQSFGPIAIRSDVFPLENPGYYEPVMGAGLKKVFVAFENLIDPALLADIKHQTNAWEALYQRAGDFSEQRPLNLDPGYLTEAKLVLATTKDRDHRVYLGRGIYAEVTLYYQRGQGWMSREWTYPDYRSPPYHPFFTRCRDYLRERKHER